MPKKEIMRFAISYACFYAADEISGNYGPLSRKHKAHTNLSDSIDAALKRARLDALEEAAKECEKFTHYGEASGIVCVRAIRALKETK